MNAKGLLQFQNEMKPYWTLGSPCHFVDLHIRVANCAQKIDRLRGEAINYISQAFKAPETLNDVLTQQWALLQEGVEETREIERLLDPAFKICSEAYYTATKDNAAFLGDYEAFDQRTMDLGGFICKVYKDSLYPFLQVLQNAKSGWNPSGIFCQACDYYSWWRVHNPKNEIEIAFPQKQPSVEDVFKAV